MLAIELVSGGLGRRAAHEAEDGAGDEVLRDAGPSQQFERAGDGERGAAPAPPATSSDGKRDAAYGPNVSDTESQDEGSPGADEHTDTVVSNAGGRRRPGVSRGAGRARRARLCVRADAAAARCAGASGRVACVVARPSSSRGRRRVSTEGPCGPCVAHCWSRTYGPCVAHCWSRIANLAESRTCREIRLPMDELRRGGRRRGFRLDLAGPGFQR